MNGIPEPHQPHQPHQPQQPKAVTGDPQAPWIVTKRHAVDGPVETPGGISTLGRWMFTPV